MGRITMGPKNQSSKIEPRQIKSSSPQVIEKIVIQEEKQDLSPIIKRIEVLENETPQIPVDLSSLESRLSELEGKPIAEFNIKDLVMDTNYIDAKFQELEDRIEYNENTVSARLSTKSERKDYSEFKENIISAFEDIKSEISYIKLKKQETKVIQKENKFFKPLVIINLVLMILCLIKIIGSN